MKKLGFTLVEVLIVLAIVGIAVAAVAVNYVSHETRQNCLKGHEQATNAMICKPILGGGQRCVPETKFVCDEYKAER